MIGDEVSEISGIISDLIQRPIVNSEGWWIGFLIFFLNRIIAGPFQCLGDSSDIYLWNGTAVSVTERRAVYVLSYVQLL